MTRLPRLMSLAGLVLVGCRSAAPVLPARGDIQGTYEYTANMAGQQYRGVLRVVGDTMLVEPKAEYCQPVTGDPDPMAIRYTCMGTGTYDRFSLHLDRRNPAQFSTWTATRRVRKFRQVCVQYSVDSSGRQVCVRTRSEPYEVTESQSGRLLVRRISP